MECVWTMSTAASHEVSWVSSFPPGPPSSTAGAININIPGYDSGLGTGAPQWESLLGYNPLDRLNVGTHGDENDLFAVLSNLSPDATAASGGIGSEIWPGLGTIDALTPFVVNDSIWATDRGNEENMCVIPFLC